MEHLKSSSTASQCSRDWLILKYATHLLPTFLPSSLTMPTLKMMVSWTNANSNNRCNRLTRFLSYYRTASLLRMAVVCMPACCHLMISGITYSTSAIHLGNALILLKSPAPNKYLPARIDYIAQILFDDTDDGHLVTFIAAWKYKPSAVNIDPFRAFPFLQTQLWSRDLDSLELYPLQSIECHFAQSLVSWENSDLMVMISLSRVCVIHCVFCSLLIFLEGDDGFWYLNSLRLLRDPLREGFIARTTLLYQIFIILTLCKIWF